MQFIRKRLTQSGFIAWTLLLTCMTGCVKVGPDYKRPETENAAVYKATQQGHWKTGKPLDQLPKGKWWEIFGDPELNRLETHAQTSNQNLKAAFAVMNQARAIARVSQSEFYPNLNLNPSYRRERFSPNQEPDFGALTANTIRMPLDLSYEIDLWGRVRRGFESTQAEAAAETAAFHHILLTLQADVALNYFSLRSLDAEIDVIHRTIKLRQDQLGIVSNRFEIGLGNELDVARAEADLAGTEAELALLQRRRVQLENALALLVGESPSEFSLTFPTDTLDGLNNQVPQIPPGLPSDLLERRPDIAEAERRLAADNARIGIAKASFFPAVSLTASGGVLSADVQDLFTWDSRIWSFGPALSLPLFAGGRNAANLNRARAQYEESVARYRQQILLAFGEVENALADITLLKQQRDAQERAFTSARRAYDLALENFSAGLINYLDVIDAGRAALVNHRINIQLTGERYMATVQLIKALGGGWEADS